MPVPATTDTVAPVVTPPVPVPAATPVVVTPAPVPVASPPVLQVPTPVLQVPTPVQSTPPVAVTPAVPVKDEAPEAPAKATATEVAVEESPTSVVEVTPDSHVAESLWAVLAVVLWGAIYQTLTRTHRSVRASVDAILSHLDKPHQGPSREDVQAIRDELQELRRQVETLSATPKPPKPPRSRTKAK